MRIMAENTKIWAFFKKLSPFLHSNAYQLIYCCIVLCYVPSFFLGVQAHYVCKHITHIFFLHITPHLVSFSLHTFRYHILSVRVAASHLLSYSHFSLQMFSTDFTCPAKLVVAASRFGSNIFTHTHIQCNVCIKADLNIQLTLGSYYIIICP